MPRARLRWSTLASTLFLACSSSEEPATQDASSEDAARVDTAAPVTDSGATDTSPITDTLVAPADAVTVDSHLPSADAVGPTPPPEWVSITHDLAGLASECGNVNGVFPDPSSDLLFAGIARQGLYRSTDGGETWALTGATGDKILNRAASVVWDPAHASTLWYTGIYGWESPFTSSVFISTDRGVTFHGYGTLATIQSSNDSIAVDLSDPTRKTLLSGGHEQKGVLFLSTDAGATWKDIGKSLPAGSGFCTATLVVDAKTYVVGCAASWSGAAGMIVRSTDGGASWTSVYGKGVSAQPLWASDDSMYWAVEGGGIVRSTDRGKTWTAVADAGKAGNLRPFELPDARIVSTKGKSVVVSADHGATWKNVGKDIPFQPNTLTYSGIRNAFYASYFTCSGANAVPADSIVRFGWDYRALAP